MIKLSHSRLTYILGVCLFASILSGCGGAGGPMQSYSYSGHNPHSSKKILVLPFLDARTFISKNETLKLGEMEEKGQDIFAAALKRNEAFRKSKILTPSLDRPKHSITSAEALAAGKDSGCDTVVCGQMFSYTDTRAASHPPKAGMFVRVFSVPEKRMVFMSDHYESGHDGGREKQAEVVADKIVQRYAENGNVSEEDGSIRIPVTSDDIPSIMVLPFHELKNNINIIEETGAGPVATGIYSLELARLNVVNIKSPGLNESSHSKLLPVEEAIRLAKAKGADYVLRGQVVEFRRAVNVPNPYLAIISVWALAGQMILAEQCGTDIALEIWRVSDGKCIFTKRDVHHTKYVIQIEGIIRDLARETATAMKDAIQNPPKESLTALIDNIVLPKTPPRKRYDPNNAAAKDNKEATKTEKTESAGKTEINPKPVPEKAKVNIEKAPSKDDTKKETKSTTPEPEKNSSETKKNAPITVSPEKEPQKTEIDKKEIKETSAEPKWHYYITDEKNAKPLAIMTKNGKEMETPFEQDGKIYWQAWVCKEKDCSGIKNGVRYIFARTNEWQLKRLKEGEPVHITEAEIKKGIKPGFSVLDGCDVCPACKKAGKKAPHKIERYQP